MEIINIKLSDLKIDDLYHLSYPIRPEACQQKIKKISPLPAIIINSKDTIIHGIDMFYYFKSRNRVSVYVLKIDIHPKEALILNYNLKKNIFGINLYERLIFLQKIRQYLNPKDLYQRVEFKISINQELLSKLDLLCGDNFRNVLINEKINLGAALRICNQKKKDQKELIDLFKNFNFTTSQQLILIEMIEEIIFRDKSTIEEIIEKARVASFQNQERAPKKILSQIYQLRYPLYTQMEKKWKEKIKKLKLPDPIKISHAPFFEKKEIQLKATFKDLDEVKEILEKLKK